MRAIEEALLSLRASSVHPRAGLPKIVQTGSVRRRGSGNS